METLFTPRRGTIVGDARLAGQEEGREEGRVAGKAEQLLRLMERRGFSLTEETRQRVKRDHHREAPIGEFGKPRGD